MFAVESPEADNAKGDAKNGAERQDNPNKDRSVMCCRTKGRYVERRVKSELALEESLPWHFEEGMAYHCFSFGDVDSLTYLRAIVKQQRVEYAMLSTWCMAVTDVDEIRKWLQRGYLGRIDFYVGEIFQASYAAIYLMLSDLVREFGGGQSGNIQKPLKGNGWVRGTIRLRHRRKCQRKHKPAIGVCCNYD